MSAPKNSQIIRIVGIQTPTTGPSQLRGKDCKLITLQRNGLSDETHSEQNIMTVASTSSPTASNRNGKDLHKIPSALSESEVQRRRNLDDGTFVIERKVTMFYGKRLRIDKSEKGLRHFSMKVSEKVKQKGKTTYNEVADELVEEFTRPIPSTSGGITRQYDQKNVRRRVYDALNVLMAMNIISKEKKEIKWIGLPTNSLQECLNLEREKQERLQRIRQKTEQLHELIANQVAFKRLVEKNIKHEQEIGSPVPTSAIPLPFVVINTDKQTVIDCSISEDRSEYVFTFDSQYQVHDDFDILKMMGLDMGLGKEQCSPEVIKQAEKFVPEVLRKYVADVANGKIEMSMQELEEDIKITNKLIMKPMDVEKHYSTIDDDLDYKNMSEIDEQYSSE